MYSFKTLTKAAAFSAGIFVTSITAAHAADPIGASIDIDGRVIVEEVGADANKITVDGEFTATNTITNFDESRDFRLQARLEAGGGVFVDEDLVVTGSVNDLLGAAGPFLLGPPGNQFAGITITDVVNFVDPFFQNPVSTVTLANPIFGSLNGLDVNYAFTNVQDGFPGTLAADFSFDATLTDAQIVDLTGALASGLGVTTFEPAFAFTIDASISAVPAPAALPMLLGGFAVLGLMGWRRRAAA